jgi:hypothetical protein
VTASAKGKGGASKASPSSAAKREKAQKGPVVTFVGVEIKLPAVLPDTFSYDFAELSALEDTDAVSAAGATYNLVSGLIGPDQFRAVREAIREKGSGPPLIEFLVEIIRAYGTDPGESEASARS